MTARFLLACWLGATLLRLPLHAAQGDLDVTFGAGGVVSTPLEGLHALLLQPDGKVVVAGGVRVGGGILVDFAVSRYGADGSPDPTFGSAGTATTDFAGSYDTARAVVLQPDGKIVAVGETQEGDGSSHFGLARYNPDGSPTRRSGWAAR